LETGEKLIFYHFSRYKFSETGDTITYYNRFSLDTLPALKRLYLAYKEKLLANQYYVWSKISFAYGRPMVHLPIPQPKIKNNKITVRKLIKKLGF
jgi:hypothetical protein